MTTFSKIILTIFILLLADNSYAQNNETSPLNKKERTEVIKAISQQLNDNYVFPDVAKKMTAFIKKQQKKGHYKNMLDTQEFANAITKDLLSISHDKHIRVAFDPVGIARQNQAVTPEDNDKLQQSRTAMMQRSNYGFKEVKILDGNIGYLDLRGFVSASDGAKTAIAAMNFLSNSGAIIIDLRKNGGGDPTMIQLISSYLFDDEPVHLNNFYWRPADLNTQTWTLPYVPGKRSPDTPVYVLTSQSTFSAAEEFSYNLKNLERATLIGETTGGGAHPGGMVNATDRYQIWVPSGRAINPITNTNWEGTGVSPHIEVKQEQALATAHLHALSTLSDASEDKQLKQFYNWTVNGLKAESDPFDIDKRVLKSFVGKYGPRVISMKDKTLNYQREGGRKFTLKAINENEFILEGLSSFRIKFESKDNKVLALIGLYENGRTDRNLKD